MKAAPKVSSESEWWTFWRFVWILAGIVFAVFPKVALGLNTFFYRDFGALGYPCGAFLRDSLLRGELPLWNPYSHCGVPFMAQMGVWYPGWWLYALLPMPWAVNFIMLLHLVLGGAGAYALARRWGIGGFVASFAGVAYAFNGVSLSCFQWGNYIASLGLLPWVIITVTKAWKRGGRWLGIAAVISALQVLTATPELTLISWLFIAVLWLLNVFRSEIKPWQSATRVVTIVVLAGGITMVQMLPFFDLLTHSQRELNYQSTRWAMPGWGWANLLVPLFHNFRAPDGIWYQHDQEFLLSYYLGAGVLILAVAGALKRSRLALALATMSLFCWTLALGSEGHLYDWIKSVFPYISIARFFVKYTILTSLLIPLLAAFGIEGILSSPGTKAQKQITILGTGALLLMGFLLWFAWRYSFRFDEWASTGWDTLWRALIMIAILTGVLFLPKQKNNRARYTLQAVLLGLVLTDALTHNPLMTPTLPSSYLAPGMWTGSGKPPSPELGKGRIMISPEAEAHLLRNAITRFDYIFTGKRLAEWSNLNLVDQIPKVTGALTLRPAHFDYIEKYLYYTEDASYGEGFLDFVSAAWISSKENPVQWTARTNFLPVMTAGQRPEFANDQLALIGITTNNFDPRAMVYLPESVRSLVTVSNTTVCKLANVRFSLNKVEAETDASETSMVVLSQTFYHLWHAEVDGKPTPLLRANVAFQALQVPPGIHQIKLIYRDRNFVIGGIISLLSLFLCIALALCEHFLSGSKQPAHLPEK